MKKEPIRKNPEIILQTATVRTVAEVISLSIFYLITLQFLDS